LAISRAGSLSGAARDLQVHQTTVGRRLSALEEALGFPLFLRTPGGLLPTGDGAQVLSSIEVLASSLTRFEQGVRGELSGIRGLVRVAVTETGARQLLEAAIPAVLREHDGLVLELVPANTVIDLSRGEADLAVRLVQPDEGLVARKLGMVRYGLYGSTEYVRRGEPTSDGLAGHEIVLPSRELSKGPEATWLAQHASRARTVLHASSLITAATAIERGIGLSVLPTNLAAMHPRAKLLRPLPEIAQRPVFLVMHPDQRRLPRVRVVAEAVGNEIKRRLDAG
jgi:DNA-binding transcriptional LysR family regulator